MSDYDDLQSRIVALELMMRGVWTGLAGHSPPGSLESNRQALAASIGQLNPNGDEYVEQVLAAAIGYVNQHFDAIAQRVRDAGGQP